MASAQSGDGSLNLDGRGRTWMIVALVIALLGIGVSIYSTVHHLQVKASGQTDAACNINATFNCDSVALSKYSEIVGIPLGVLGIGYFLAMIVLIGLGLSGTKTAREHIHAYVGMVGIGVLVSLALAGISVFGLGAGCPTCIAIYVLCLAQGAALFAFKSEIPAGLNPKSMLSGGSTAAIAVAVVIAAFSWLKPAPRATDEAAKPNDPNVPTMSTSASEIPIARSAYAGLGEDYRKGADTAKVTIVEFADLQCPACQRVASTVDAIQKEYGDRVQVVFRNYPLDQACNSGVQHKMHEFACKAAVMARCAGQYGKFWQYHDLAFAMQADISEPKTKEWAKQIGLTDEQINGCWDNKDLLAKIKDDIDLGTKLGVDSTPTIFINGRKVLGGKGIQDMRQEIDQLLN